MSLIFHIVKKDLRRFWLPLVVFATVIVAKLGLGALLLWRVNPANGDFFGRLTLYLNLVSVIEGLAGFILVAAIVQEDPLVGTEAFWMTKPISGAALLTAKFVTVLAAILVVPVFVTIPWWLACDFGIREIGIAARDSVFFHGLVVVVAFPLAVLTKTSGRYLAALLIAFTCAVVMSIFQAATAGHASTIPSDLLVTRSWIALGLAVTGSGALVVHQYVTRRVWRSGALAAVTVASIVAVARYWPWAWSASEPSSATNAAALSDHIEVALRQAHLPPAYIPIPEPIQLSMDFRITGVPNKLEIYCAHSLNTWSWPDATKLERRGSSPIPPRVLPSDVSRLLDLPGMTADWSDFAANRSAALDERAGIGAISRDFYPVKVSVPASFRERLLGEPSHYEFDGRFELLEPTLLGEGPARDGGLIRLGSRGLRLGNSHFESNNDLALSLVEWAPVHDSPRGIAFRISAQMPVPVANSDLWLVNHTQGNAVGIGQPNSSEEISVAGVRILRRNATFHSYRKWDPKSRQWLEQPDWFRDLTLAKFTLRKIATFHRHLRVDHLETTADSPGIRERK
jgi:hypothetical protein